MPDAIARIARERTLGTLVRNLFVIESPDDEARATRAEALILAANPGLGEREGFRAGAAVVVPAGIGLRRSDRAGARAAGADGPMGEVADRIEAARTLGDERLKVQGVEARLALRLLGGDELRRALIGQPGGEALLARAEEEQKRRLEEAEVVAAALGRAMEAAAAALKGLIGRAGPR